MHSEWTTHRVPVRPTKTHTRRLTKAEAILYEAWIANDRSLRSIIKQMRNVAAKAAKLKI